ncbi:hypothetical protein I4U23_002790 [Adineta vaga]|nr:hypothetical protein I4U23_002790 [Adineta vaga]
MPCTVCGSEPATMNFGAICCSSCNMFFRRNEYFDFQNSKCRFSMMCNIQKYNRRTYRYCRLSKCFSVGMKQELFRSSRIHDTLLLSQRKEVIYPLNLLFNDSSTLSIKQWSLLSNIINTYDARYPIDNLKKSLEVEANLPVKMRMKLASTNYMNYVTLCYALLIQFLQGVSHFNIVSKGSRSILIERTMSNLGGLNGLFIVRELNLHINYEYITCTIETYGLTIIHEVVKLAHRIDQDGILFKLVLVVLSFSTCYNTIYTTDDDHNVTLQSNSSLNSMEIFSIQNIYVDVMFKFLLYRYGYDQAVLRFGSLIKTILDQNRCLEEARNIIPHTFMIKTVMEYANQIISSQISS